MMKSTILRVVVTLVLLAIAVGGWFQPAPEPPVIPLSTNLTSLSLSSTLDVTGNTTLGGTLGVTGASTVAALTASGTLTGQGIVDVGTFVNLSAQTAISVTAGAVITPTGTYQPLTSASAVTCSTSKCIEDGTTTGDILILRNANAADAITIDGTGGNVECKADVPLGAGDTLWLIWSGSDWNCLSTYDNS